MTLELPCEAGLFFEHSRAGMAIISPGLKILQVNPSLCSLLLGQPSALINKDWPDFVAPEIRVADAETFARAKLQGTGLHSYDGELIAQNGCPFHARVSVQWIDSPRTEGWYWAQIEDLSTLARANQALSRNQAFLDDLFATSNAMIIGLNVEGQITTYNDAAEKISGYRKEEIQGSNWFETLVPKGRFPEVREELSRLLEGGLPQTFINPILTKKGEERVISWQNGVIHQDGRIAGSLSFGIDITDQALQEQKANALFERNQQILQTCMDGYILADDHGQILDANPAYCHIMGYSRSELLQMNIADLEASIPVTELPDFIAQLVAAGGMRFETRHRAKNGSLVDLEVSITVMSGAEGPLVTAFVRDISLRKQEEDRLRESERRFSALFHSLPIMLALVRVDDNSIVEVNRGFTEQIGYLPEEAVGRSASDLNLWIDPEHRSRMTERIRAVGSAPPEMVALRQKSGETVYHLLSFEKVVLDHQPHFVVAGIDVSDLKQLEDALREKERMLTEAQRIGKIGSWSLDLLANQLSWSDEVYRIFEEKPQSFGVTYEAFLDHVHPDDRKLVADAYEHSVATHAPYSIEHRLCPFPGGVKYVHERGETFYDDEGRPVRSIGTVQDITARKELETQLRQTQKIDALGRLAGGVAHDFNNLLMVIMGMTELSLSKVGEVSPIRPMLQEVLQTSERAAELTRQLLIYSRHKVDSPQIVDLNRLVSGVEKMLRRLIGEDVSLHIHLSEGLGPVMVDPGQFEQVVVNLALNARDAMPTGGSLSLETSELEPGPEFKRIWAELPEAEGYLQLLVSDTGSGIAEEHLGKIFEPFYTTKPVGQGTGLGLSVVQGVVQQAGGGVRIESSPGHGARVYIVLPRSHESPTVKIKASPAIAAGDATILLVEDDSGVRTTIQASLVAAGYRVLVASDGDQAINLSAGYSGRIDLLVSDVVMPGMRGPQVAEQLRHQRPELKILYISGYPDDALVRRGVQTAHASLLAKPFSSAEFTHKISEILSSVGDGGSR